MRRHDRELTDPAEICAILEKCDSCVLSMFDGDYPYSIPMNFGWKLENGEVTIFFHCAPEGKKLELIRRNPRVSLTADCSHRLFEGAVPCAWGMDYESVCAVGTAEIIENDPEGTREALTRTMIHYGGEREYPFAQKTLEMMTTIRVRCVRITGKSSIKPEKSKL